MIITSNMLVESDWDAKLNVMYTQALHYLQAQLPLL